MTREERIERALEWMMLNPPPSGLDGWRKALAGMVDAVYPELAGENPTHVLARSLKFPGLGATWVRDDNSTRQPE